MVKEPNSILHDSSVENLVVRSFRKNIFMYLSTNILVKVLTFVLWFIFARIIEPAEIGKYALAMSLIEIISVFCLWSSDSSLLRFNQKVQSQSVFTNSLFILVISSFVFLCFFKIFSTFLFHLSPSFVFISESSRCIALVIAIIFLNSLTNLLSVHYTSLGSSFIYSKLQITQSIVFMIVSLFLLMKGWGFVGLLYARIVSLLIPVAGALYDERSLLKFNYLSKDILSKLLRYGTPLTFSTIIGVFSSYLGRFLLDRYTNLSLLGVYSFFLMISTNIHMLFHGFNQAWTPKIFFEKDRTDSSDTNKKCLNLIYIFIFSYLTGLFLVLLAGDTFLFKLVLKTKYLDSINIFYILLLGPLFSGISIILYPLIYFEQKTNRIFYISFVMSIFNLLCTFIAVKYFSVEGAAWSYFLINVFSVFVNLVMFRSIINFWQELFSHLLVVFILLILGFILVTASSYTHFLPLFLIFPILYQYRKRNSIRLLIPIVTETKDKFIQRFKEMGL